MHVTSLCYVIKIKIKILLWILSNLIKITTPILIYRIYSYPKIMVNFIIKIKNWKVKVVPTY